MSRSKKNYLPDTPIIQIYIMVYLAGFIDMHEYSSGDIMLIAWIYAIIIFLICYVVKYC